MTHTPLDGLDRALARHPRLLATLLGLAMLLFATPINADERGSAQNPIFLPGTETYRPRPAPRDAHVRALLRHGSFEAAVYALPATSLAPGLGPRLSFDASASEAVARGRLDAGEAGAMALGATGLRLSVDPSWDVEIEGRRTLFGEMDDPATFARTRGTTRAAEAGLEVRF